MNTLTFKYYSDPAHGWVAVKKKLLVELGIADQISPYSYHKGQTAYLEEDCDAARLEHALKQNGITVSYVTKTTNNRSPIRSYESYSYSV
jgi:hypothetical protein